MKIAIINGPNLNLLGKRQPEIYGGHSFEEYLKQLREAFSHLEISYFQSNIEGELVNALHKVAEDSDGIILNPAAFTHTSVALGDAVKSLDCPLIEVHISNIFQREEFRHFSYVSSGAKAVISGMGLRSYELALRYFLPA
jgi:3-dehydroquinate dehydratase-2